MQAATEPKRYRSASKQSDGPFPVFSQTTIAQAQAWLTTQEKEHYVAGAASTDSQDGPAIRLYSKTSLPDSVEILFTRAAYSMMQQNSEGLPCHLNDRLRITHAVLSDRPADFQVGILRRACVRYVETENLRQQARNPYARNWEERETELRTLMGGKHWRAIRTVLAHLPPDFDTTDDVERLRFNLNQSLNMLSRHVETDAFFDAVEFCLSETDSTEPFAMKDRMEALFHAAHALLLEAEVAGEDQPGTGDNDPAERSKDALARLAELFREAMASAPNGPVAALKTSPKLVNKPVFTDIHSTKNLADFGDPGDPLVQMQLRSHKAQAGLPEKTRSVASPQDNSLTSKKPGKNNGKERHRKIKKHPSMPLSGKRKKQEKPDARGAATSFQPSDETAFANLHQAGNGASKEEIVKESGKSRGWSANLKHMLQQVKPGSSPRRQDQTLLQNDSESDQVLTEPHSESSSGAEKRLSYCQSLQRVPDNIRQDLDPGQWETLEIFFSTMDEIEKMTRQPLGVVIPSSLAKINTAQQQTLKSATNYLVSCLDENNYPGLTQTMKTIDSFISAPSPEARRIRAGKASD